VTGKVSEFCYRKPVGTLSSVILRQFFSKSDYFLKLDWLKAFGILAHLQDTSHKNISRVPL